MTWLASTALGPVDNLADWFCRGRTSTGLISTGNHWWLVKRHSSTLEARTVALVPLAHRMQVPLSCLPEGGLLPSACFTPLQVSAAIDIRASPGPQAAVMYALQLALDTEEYCEPQDPGEEAGPDPFGPDPFSTPSKDLAQPATGMPAMSPNAGDMHLQSGPFAEGWTGQLLEGLPA